MKRVYYSRPVLKSRLSRIGIAFLVTAVSASCASQYVNQLSQVSARSSAYHIPTELSVDACRESLLSPETNTHNRLDATNIRLVNWNIQKETNQSWQKDFDSLSDGKDLVLIQEASLRSQTINDLDDTKHWSFAPGYRKEGEITGVMTLSTIKPLTQCSFVNLEPVLRTPKATNITQYALSGTDKTLVVVNVHAINFSWSLGAFQEQFDQILETLSEHKGPIIISGDLNTWRGRRMQIVEKLAESLSLDSLKFVDDQRTRVMGQTLDHIFVRGFTVIDSATHAVTTSDHNPMTVTFSM